MAKYSGKPVVVNGTPQNIAERFSNLDALKEKLGEMPDEQRRQIGDIQIEGNAIVMHHNQVGDLRFSVEESTPQRVRFAIGGPLPMQLNIHLQPVGDAQTQLVGEVDLDIPMMLRPILGPQMQKAADQLSDVMAKMAAQ